MSTAEVTPRERLQPALLDRLTDHEPQKKVEPRDRRVLSIRRLKEGVLRDLGWLLNTSHFEAIEDLEPFPAVRMSVVNYGIPDFSGLVAAGMDVAALERAVHKAIVDFEPRIARKSLKVTIKVDTRQMSRNTMVFEIEGELWAEPTPLALFLKTELDLESGSITIAEG
jgi:type VI secretion system protein ImpF